MKERAESLKFWEISEIVEFRKEAHLSNEPKRKGSIGNERGEGRNVCRVNEKENGRKLDGEERGK